MTQLVSKYEQPFDEFFWSHYKACEALLSLEDWKGLKPILLQTRKWNDKYIEIYELDPQELQDKVDEIIEGYVKKREEACSKGTELHAKKEMAFYEDATKEVKKYGLGGQFSCIPGYYQLDLERGVYPEFLISYDFGDLKVSGQVDLLVVDGDEITIGDHKTNDSIDKESYFDKRTKKHVMMKAPLGNLQDSNYWHYAAQLSCYMYLLQKTNPRYKCKRLFLNHIDKKTGKEEQIDVPYLRDEVEKMIKHYAKQHKINEALDKLKTPWDNMKSE